MLVQGFSQSGSRLEPFWLKVGAMWAQGWNHFAKIRAHVGWPTPGPLGPWLKPFCFKGLAMLAECWSHLGSRLEPFGLKVGSNLAQCLSHIGSRLELCRLKVGAIFWLNVGAISAKWKHQFLETCTSAGRRLAHGFSNFGFWLMVVAIFGSRLEPFGACTPVGRCMVGAILAQC